MNMYRLSNALITTSALMLAACGGGGGGGSGSHPVSTPPPPPPPPPTPTPGSTTSLDIIAGAPTGELAVAGVAFSGAYGDPEPMKTVSFDAQDQPRIRYDAATQTYDVMLPGGTWDKLERDSVALPAWAARLTPTSDPYSGSLLLSYERSLDSPDPYPSSTIGNFFLSGAQGWLALGIPTPDAGLPVSGSATYNGILMGSSDVLIDDGWGGFAPSDVTGNVTLSFDFTQSSLSGSMTASLHDWSGGTLDANLGTFTFNNTVYSAGTYSGTFDTAVPGVNSFAGRLTGPTGQELIGSWALPFSYSDTNHQAVGAWIAKK
jgi:hypothetical protein